MPDIVRQNCHWWQDDGATQVIGAVITTRSDGEEIAEALEAAGILVLPDHRFNGQAGKPVADALSAYGVNPSDTTSTAIAKVHSKSGHPMHKARRFV
jgi:hypothetical protein